MKTSPLDLPAGAVTGPPVPGKTGPGSARGTGGDVLLEYRAIFDSAAVGILYTRNRTFQRCNARGAAILGYTPEELEGLPGSAVYPSAESYDEIGRRAGPLLGAGAAFEADWEWKRKDGARIWCRIWARAVNPSQTDLGTVWIIEDVTQARAVERAHQQAVAELQAMMDNASVAIVITRDRTITRCNPMFCEMFGWSQRDAVGLPGRDLYCSEEDYVEVSRLAGPLLSRGKAFQREMFARRADGSRLWVNLIGYVVDLADPTRGTIWLIEDRSAMKTAEEALRKRNLDQLRETNRRLEETQNQLVQSEKLASIGQLAAGVAHEINNPVAFVSSNMNVLSDYSQRLLRLVEAQERALGAVDLPADARAELEAVRASADLAYVREDLVELLRDSGDGLRRVRQIVRDLKDFSHTGAGEWRASDLNACLESTLNVARSAIQWSVVVEQDLGELPYVRCQPAQINQVMMNLLVNAAQAIDGAGTIHVRTGGEGDWVWFEVQDSGSGMSEEIQERVFEPFFTTKPVGKGTGLGLSVSYGIVSRHGGRIELASAPGAGARFRVWLPLSGPGEGVDAPRSRTRAA